MRITLLAALVVGGSVSLVACSHTSANPTPSKPDLGNDIVLPSPPALDEAIAPAPVAERAIDGPPLSLTASDGSGLAIASLRASAVVSGPLAFTEIKLAFDNQEARVREGTFKIVLPQGASLSRFAMKINESWQEGEVVPKERARVAYEDALHRKQDPALLERGAGNEFTARVFPIPAHGRKEIVVSYAEQLVGGAQYALPLRGLPEVGILDVSVGGEGMKIERMHQERVAPTADFVLESGKRPMPSALRAGNLVVARVRPIAEAMPDPVSRAIVLVDTSASRALGLASELRTVQALLQGLADKRGGELPVTVAAFDQEVAAVYHGDARGFGQAEMDRLVSRRALGASNLEMALGWAKEEAKRTGSTRVVLVTDGVPTAGEEDGAALAKAASALKEGGAERLDVVAVGGLRDDALARKLVTAGLPRDGVVVAGADGTATMVRRLEAGTKSDVAVAVEGASWFYPTHLDGVQPGDEVLVYAELEKDAVTAPLHVKVGGVARTLDAVPVEKPLVERAWAQAKIASLEADERDHGKSLETENKIVELSTAHRVLSEYTALLVLETDADYARFHIDRRSLTDILSVNDGALAWTKRGDLAGAQRASRPVEAPKGDLLQGAIGHAGAPEPADDPQVRTREAKMENDIGDSFGAGGLGLSGVGEGGGGRAAPEHGRLGGAHQMAPPAARRAPTADGTGTRARGEEGSMGVASAPPPPSPAPTAAAAGGDLRMFGPTAASMPAQPLAAAAPAGNGGYGAAASVAGRETPNAYAASGGADKENGVDPFTGKLKQVKDRLARGAKNDALTLASSWEQSEPGDVLALVALGETSEATGDASTAARAYGSIIDLFPSRADLRRFAGERLEHVKGKDALDLAIDTFDKARRDRPDHPASHRLAAFARVRRGEYAAAFDILVAGLAQRYPTGRFAGVDQILREDLGLVAAAWMKAEPARQKEILARLRSAGGRVEDEASIRFVLNWETDANDVDFHIHDAQGGHAFFNARHLESGGDLYADVTTGYGPECFTIRASKGHRAAPYKLQAHYYSRGPMGYGMGKLEIIDHDGHGGLTFEERPFIVMVDQAYVDLGTVR